MIAFLVRLARWLWPDFDAQDRQDQVRLLSELALVLLSAPLVVAGLAWLVASTDLALVRAEWPTFLLLLALGYALQRLSYFQVLGTRSGEFSFNSTSLISVLLASAILLFGPTALWVFVLLILLFYAARWPRRLARTQRWNWLRNLLYNLWVGTIASLAALAVYAALGGQVPLPGLSLDAAWPAVAAVTVLVVLNSLFLLLIFAVQIRLLVFLMHARETAQYRQTSLFFLLSEVPAYFGIMAAGLYNQISPGVYLFFMAGVVMVSLLARRLSQAAVVGQQRSREVTQLEQLGRAIIGGPPDASTLPALLAEYLPQMFPYRQAEIRLFAGAELLHLPADRPGLPAAFWPWLHEHPSYRVFESGEPLPWSGEAQPYRLIVAPILASERAEPLGGIALVQDASFIMIFTVDLQPALQALAAQIASTLHSAEAYRRALEHQKMSQELAFAGQIQASFLPAGLPELPGWQLAAALQPARETSGDFYDAFALPNGKLGLLVADVSDKGMGAALYMALSRTLLRTYAAEYHTRPDFVLRVANHRILADTQAEMFVSVFYGVVDPYAGTLTYANAGHNPAFLLCSNGGAPQVRMLGRTGMVLGVVDGGEWEQATLVLAPGDTLVLYSDGVTDAQSQDGGFFGMERLQAAVEANADRPAQAMLDAILAEVRQWVKDTPRFDDITAMIVQREL